MQIYKTQKDLEIYLDSMRENGKSIALVPTMGEVQPSEEKPELLKAEAIQ